MELAAARDECRRMLRALKAFKAVDDVLEVASALQSEADGLRTSIVKMQHEKATIESEIDQAKKTLLDETESLAKTSKELSQKLDDLTSSYDAKVRELEEEMADRMAEKSEEYNSVLRNIEAAKAMLRSIDDQISKAKSEYDAAVEKYNDFKRSL